VNPEKTQRYFNQVLKQEGIAPIDCTPDVCEQIIFNHLNAGSLLAIIPIQDWFSMDCILRKNDENSERINIPDNPKHYWKYRMHIDLDTLINENNLNKKIINVIKITQR